MSETFEVINGSEKADVLSRIREDQRIVHHIKTVCGTAALKHAGKLYLIITSPDITSDLRTGDNIFVITCPKQHEEVINFHDGAACGAALVIELYNHLSTLNPALRGEFPNQLIQLINHYLFSGRTKDTVVQSELTKSGFGQKPHQKYVQ